VLALVGLILVARGQARAQGSVPIVVKRAAHRERAGGRQAARRPREAELYVSSAAAAAAPAASAR